MSGAIEHKQRNTAGRKRGGHRSAVDAVALLSVPVVLIACALSGMQQTALISTLSVLVALVPFFVNLELDRLTPRDIMPIVVFATLAVAGRIVFAPLPNIKPVSAIVIMAGLSFGRHSGFMVGALAALVSNLFFGQGPWTPWQMYAWGLMGYGAGVLEDHGAFKHKAIVFVYAALAPLLYGVIMDSYFVVGYLGEINTASVLTAYGLGALSSLAHAVATVIFLVPIYLPWTHKLKRLKYKYGISTL
ncbi:MAG: ECF transporter S component [Coriobacteriales bacterium]|jgi:energy-coupling factor transport system substrate-specific component|nr:ECF transporter S component [Coriobacteriales bacterium]